MNMIATNPAFGCRRRRDFSPAGQVERMAQNMSQKDRAMLRIAEESHGGIRRRTAERLAEKYDLDENSTQQLKQHLNVRG